MTIITQISSVIFLILLTLSTIISTIDKQHSYEVLLLWCVGILIFLTTSFVKIKFSFLANSFFIFTLFCISLYGLYILKPQFFLFLNHGPYQFIIPTKGGGHNHLGDLVGLSLVFTYVAQTSLLSRFDIVFFYIVMLASFSKSSFLAMSTTYATILLKKKGSYIYGVIIFVLAVFALLLYTEEFSIYSPIQRVQHEFISITHLQPKPLLSVREFYIQQVVKSWQTSDFATQFFGFGLGNFAYPSQKNASELYLGAPVAHNILLSLFIESGLLPVIWFFIFSVFVLISGFMYQSLTVYPFLYLFIHFQTDYTFHIPFFFFCFFIFAGQSIDGRYEKQSKIILLILISISLTITAFTAYMLQSITTQKTHLLQTLHSQIKKQDSVSIVKTLEALEQFQPYNKPFLVSSSSIYEAFGDNKNAVRLLEKLSVYSPREYLTNLPHQLVLQKKMNVNIKKYIQARKKEFAQFPFTKEEKKELNDVCEDYAKMKCIK